MNLKVGDRFPELNGQGIKGEIEPGELKGKKVVIYFYPKDNTPGCTKEAKDFRDLKKEFERANTEIIGVSTDSLESHSKFAEKHGLDFNLLSDEGGILCQKCGITGALVKTAKRTTFLLDGEGIIRHIWEKVSVTGHAEEVLQKARDLT